MVFPHVNSSPRGPPLLLLGSIGGCSNKPMWLRQTHVIDWWMFPNYRSTLWSMTDPCMLMVSKCEQLTGVYIYIYTHIFVDGENVDPYMAYKPGSVMGDIHWTNVRKPLRRVVRNWSLALNLLEMMQVEHVQRDCNSDVSGARGIQKKMLGEKMRGKSRRNGPDDDMATSYGPSVFFRRCGRD